MLQFTDLLKSGMLKWKAIVHIWQYMTVPARVWKQYSCVPVVLSACYQVSLITSRLELALKVNAVKHTGYSKAWVTVDTSKYQCGLSLFCQMTHPCPVSRYYQANNIKWVWHSWIERITATIFSWCFCRLTTYPDYFTYCLTLMLEMSRY